MRFVDGSFEGQQPYAAVIGSWDPFVRAHRKLLNIVAAAAQTRGQRVLAVVLDPGPSRLLPQPDQQLPAFADRASRCAMLRATERVDTLVMEFAPSDLDASCGTLLGVLFDRAAVQELWLGAAQSLGSGDLGSPAAIASFCTRHHVAIFDLPPRRGVDLGRRVLHCLADAKVAKAIRIGGTPPTFKRSDEPVRIVDWPRGQYRARFNEPGRRHAETALAVEINVTSNDGRTGFIWPDQAPDQLSFVSGPGDE